MATNWSNILSNANSLGDIFAILQKVLAALDIKADITTIQETIEEVAGIKIDVDATLSELNTSIDGLVQEGGFAVPFKTEADILSSKPTVLKMAAKALDTNKVWLWERTSAEGVLPVTGTWIDTGLSELDQAKQYADIVSKKVAEEKVNEIASQNKTTLLSDWEDRLGNKYAYFTDDSRLFLTGLDLSVQEEIQQLAAATNNILTEEEDDLFHYRDSENKLVEKTAADGGKYLVGLDGSIQEILSGLGKENKPFTCPVSIESSADLYSNEALNSLNYLKLNDAICEPARTLIPQQYHVGKSWINSILAPLSSSRIIIGAYNDKGTATSWNADSGVVHPNIIAFDKKMAGYKYWLGINPYTNTNEDYELPYIYGTNSENLDTWELITAFPQPFDIDPPNVDGVLSGHCSDSFFTYDTSTGYLYFCWRQTTYYDAARSREIARQAVYAKRTRDGVSWSDRIEIYKKYENISNNLLLSPAVLFDPKQNIWYLYYVHNGRLYYQTSSTLENSNWSESKPVKGLDEVTAWHIDAKFIGDQVVILIHSDTVDQLYFAISDDFVNFKCGHSVLNGSTYLYKSTFFPVFNDAQEISMKIIYTTDQNSTPKWQLHATQTNFASIKD